MALLATPLLELAGGEVVVGLGPAVLVRVMMPPPPLVVLPLVGGPVMVPLLD